MPFKCEHLIFESLSSYWHRRRGHCPANHSGRAEQGHFLPSPPVMGYRVADAKGCNCYWQDIIRARGLHGYHTLDPEPWNLDLFAPYWMKTCTQFGSTGSGVRFGIAALQLDEMIRILISFWSVQRMVLAAFAWCSGAMMRSWSGMRPAVSKAYTTSSANLLASQRNPRWQTCQQQRGESIHNIKCEWKVSHRQIFAELTFYCWIYSKAVQIGFSCIHFNKYTLATQCNIHHSKVDTHPQDTIYFSEMSDSFKIIVL